MDEWTKKLWDTHTHTHTHTHTRKIIQSRKEKGKLAICDNIDGP